jgi:hypothetical protein
MFPTRMVTAAELEKMHMFETLESRRMLSAVTFADGSKASSGSGSLVVTGGGGINNLAVVENLNGVMGLNNFTVINNNTGQMADFFGITKDVHINGGGSDDVLVYNGVTLPAHITGGGGNDVITVRDLSANGGDDVDAGGGDDTVILVASHYANLNGGGGNDTFYVNTGAIDNAVAFNYAASKILINGAGGTDTLEDFSGLGTVIAKNVEIL